MQGKEAIINKILTDSQNLAGSILAEAEQKRESTLIAARTLAGDYQSKKKQDIALEEKAIISRKKSAAEIEVKKILLQKRQQVIENLFSTVGNEVKADKEKYKKLLFSLTEKYAESGDTVTISSADKDLFTENDVKKIADKKGIKLSYGTTADLSGGVKLCSKYYDKNLSLASLLKQIKEENITQIDKILFGERLNER